MYIEIEKNVQVPGKCYFMLAVHIVLSIAFYTLMYFYNSMLQNILHVTPTAILCTMYYCYFMYNVLLMSSCCY